MHPSVRSFVQRTQWWDKTQPNPSVHASTTNSPPSPLFPPFWSFDLIE
jgi:hypothetical protein